MKAKHRKPYAQMTTAELRAATREYDREELGIPGKPLTPAQKMAFRGTVKRGRPPVGQGAGRVLVSIERGLLQKADALAKRRRVNRSQLIAAALRRELARDRFAKPTHLGKQTGQINAGVSSRPSTKAG